MKGNRKRLKSVLQIQMSRCLTRAIIKMASIGDHKYKTVADANSRQIHLSSSNLK